MRGGPAKPAESPEGRPSKTAAAREGNYSKGSQTSVVAGRRPVLELLKASVSIERVFIAGHVGPSEVLADI